jgi:hypothetical protein
MFRTVHPGRAIQVLNGHKLVMLASIGEKTEALKARKRELRAGPFDIGSGFPLGLTEADIEDLFACP